MRMLVVEIVHDTEDVGTGVGVSTGVGSGHRIRSIAGLVSHNRGDIKRFHGGDHTLRSGVVHERIVHHHVAFLRPLVSMIGPPLIMFSQETIITMIGTIESLGKWITVVHRLVVTVDVNGVRLTRIVIQKVGRVVSGGLHGDGGVTVGCSVRLTGHHVVVADRVVGLGPERLRLVDGARLLHDVAQTQHPRETREGLEILLEVGLVHRHAL
mmetsp:Transcript_9595/g.29573  ORF Transcript_9595/g.29573 Transcript_9595/m.29573 type:complete len:211 (-) Transcript_9595:900-1532(-)